ncbi:substrate-binding domain-containing protein [Streptomyces sp. L7]
MTGDLDSSGASVKGQVDFARSSGGPSSSGTALTYIPMARDAVGVGVKGSALDNLTVKQLHDIYTGSLTEVNGQTVHPKIPQQSSGTRKFFPNAIGVANDGVAASVTVVQENQANSVLTEDGALVPFSVGSWIAQNNGVAPDYSKTAAAAGAHLASIQLLDDTGATSPITTVNGKLTPVNAYFENATFGRDVYNVVPSRAIDPTSIFFDKDLYDVFVTSGSHTAQLASDAAESVIAKFGFVNESYNGSVSLARHAKLGGLEEGSTFDAHTPNAPALKSTLGDASLKLSWTPNSTVPAMPVTDYRITLFDADGAVVASKDVATSTTSYSFTGLATGTYTATVTANNVNGTGAAASWTGAVKYASTTKATTATTAYGTTPKVAVTVTGTHGVVPSGKVTVKDGSTVVGTGTLNSSGKVTVNVSNHLKVATHSLTVLLRRRDQAQRVLGDRLPEDRRGDPDGHQDGARHDRPHGPREGHRQGHRDRHHADRHRPHLRGQPDHRDRHAERRQGHHHPAEAEPGHAHPARLLRGLDDGEHQVRRQLHHQVHLIQDQLTV